MLQQLAENIRECLERATSARERANAKPDPERKSEHLDMERRWLYLAESYQFVEQHERFMQEGKRNL